MGSGISGDRGSGKASGSEGGVRVTGKKYEIYIVFNFFKYLILVNEGDF